MFLEISLSCFDDKRYISDDGINSLAFFYKDVKKLIESIKSIESITSIKSIKPIKSIKSK